MAFENSIEKLDKYFARLKKKKAAEIKRNHVEKVIEKLRKHERKLKAEIRDCSKDSKKERLARKLGVAKEQRKRAEWLLEKIDAQ